ncbi:MAG: hypothetical protein ACE5DW_01990 [Thermodesulfobacteriota bacterium]
MKKFIFFTFTLIMLTVLSLWPDVSWAIPSFARQTGMACNTCHYQHYPSLNAFGRVFKANGFTMVGGQSLVEGDLLSLPAVLNASVVTKIRFQKTNGDNDDSGTNKGEFQFPDEAALFLAGRVGEHIGFLLEGQMKDAGSSMFASFKAPIGMDVKSAHVELVPFTTDALGPQFAFELLNTGAVRNIRVLEHRKQISAIQFVGLNHAAQGVAFVAYHNTGFFSFTPWQPEAGTSDSGPFLKYLRLAGTHNIAGWDLAAGGQLWLGTTKLGSGVREKARGWALDAQAQGTIVSIPVGLYLNYAEAEGTTPGDTMNIFNSNPGDKRAWSILAEVGVLPNRATIAAGYRSGNSGKIGASSESAVTVGATFLLAQNFELQVNHSFNSGDVFDIPANNELANGDQLTTLMLFAAF